ncbi:MAG TPA: DUF948 domain-containing protein [Acidimicrobiia bacterium]|nr:DUF948 domain-containing protein [Acidimicrobiia bacterium]
MSTSDVLAVIAATVVTILIASLGVVLITLTRTLRELSETVDALGDEAIALLDEARRTTRDAALEVDRVERLVTSAERIGEAKRAIVTPVVKMMAFGTGVSRAAQRLRDGEPARRVPARRRRRP